MTRTDIGGPWSGPPGSDPPTPGAIAKRLQAVRIPPNYPEATLCLLPSSRVQGYGRDQKGRLQILYHPDAVQQRQDRKIVEVLRICRERDRLVRRIHADGKSGKDVALIAWVLLETAARPGHDRYRLAHGTYGAANLRCSHVQGAPSASATVRIIFPAKHHLPFVAEVQDPEIVEVLRKRWATRCRTPQTAFWERAVDAEALNAYLESILPGLRAKHIRTWRANLHFLAVWDQLSEAVPETQARLRTTVQAVAAHLQNTPSVARKQYLLEEVLAFVQKHPGKPRSLLRDGHHPSDVLGNLLGKAAQVFG